MSDASTRAIKSTLGLLWFGFWFFLVFPWLTLTFSGREVTLAWRPATALGVSLVGAGLAVVLHATASFVRRGDGTPVPLDPPRLFVSTGLFRWVRNPMYLAYIVILLGGAIILNSGPIIAYVLAFATLTHVYVVRVEEKGLRERFGASYRDYCARVSRWVPKPPS